VEPDRAARGGEAALTLRVLPRPRPVAATTRGERGHEVPVRYRERLPDGARAPRGLPLVEVLAAAGPDRLSAGAEDGAPVAREYWQCLTDRGELVLLFRELAPGPAAGPGAHGPAAPLPAAGGPAPAAADGAGDAWFLHGWWD
jgi:hypothetical protein